VVAIVVNLALQELVLQLEPWAGWGLFPSVLAGTAGGLVFKYVWDKVLIFDYRAGSKARDAKTFLAYAVTGILTTAIFWGFEFGFDALFGTKLMRYVGAIMGLTIGYVLKYHLDRRFVFTAPQA
jgi:putative flippase GtrA